MHIWTVCEDPGKLKEILSKDLRTLSSPAGFVMKSFISKDPVGIGTPAFRKIRQLQYDENFDLYDGHIISRDGRYMLLFVSPAFPADNTGMNGQLLNGMDQIISRLQANGFDMIQANYFGGVAVAAGNAAQLRKDSILTLSITTLFLILFISWYFKKKRAPFLILLPVILGALFSLSIIYWIKGTISVIALAAGSIVLGIAINYSLHVYNHFRHRRDMRLVLQDLTFPLTIGGFTTIGGFLCLQFVQSEILKDLGSVRRFQPHWSFPEFTYFSSATDTRTVDPETYRKSRTETGFLDSSHRGLSSRKKQMADCRHFYFNHCICFFCKQGWVRPGHDAYELYVRRFEKD